MQKVFRMNGWLARQQAASYQMIRCDVMFELTGIKRQAADGSRQRPLMPDAIIRSRDAGNNARRPRDEGHTWLHQLPAILVSAVEHVSGSGGQCVWTAGAMGRTALHCY